MTLNPIVGDLHDQITFNNQILDNQISPFANKSLSNLTTTSINQDLIPNGNKNLGNTGNLFTLYSNKITNISLTNSFILDFERTSGYPFLRNRRSDLNRGFALGTDGFGFRLYVCRDMIVIKQPDTEYSNIGINTGSDVGIFGFNNNNAFIFTSNTKAIFNPSTFSAADTTAQAHFISKNNNNMDSYFLFQSSTGAEYRGGILLSTTQSNVAGNSSIKFSSSGTGNNMRFIIANIQNNAPDIINTKFIESFGDTGNYTFGRNIAFGDSTNKGAILFWVDKSNFNSNIGNGVTQWGGASAVPTGNPATNTVYEYVEDGYKKIRYSNGFIVTI